MKALLTIPNLFMLMGIGAGYLYWSQYACTEGCAITSKWYGSMLLGGLFGHLIGDVVSDLRTKFIR